VPEGRIVQGAVLLQALSQSARYRKSNAEYIEALSHSGHVISVRFLYRISTGCRLITCPVHFVQCLVLQSLITVELETLLAKGVQKETACRRLWGAHFLRGNQYLSLKALSQPEKVEHTDYTDYVSSHR